MFFKQRLPVFTSIRAGKIHKHTFATPPGTNPWLLAIAGLDKHPFFLHLFQHGMNQQNSWLHIWGYCDTSFLHLPEKIFRILKTFFIPGKYTTLDSLICLDRTVTRRKLKPIHRNIFFPGRINKFHNRVIAICLQLWIIHRRSQISQCITGQHR